MTAPDPNIARNAPSTTLLQSDSPDVLSDERLHAPVDGYQLQGDTLAELVDDTTLLVFLRHFG